VISQHQDSSYDDEMIQEEQEVFEYSYSELVINSVVQPSVTFESSSLIGCRNSEDLQ